MHFAHPTTLTGPGAPAIDLYADASTLDGAASVQRVRLPARALGAAPHFHVLSSELFYVINGSMWFLEDDNVFLAPQGTLVTITPRTVHAFAAADDAADALIVLVPGVERFGYFHLLAGVAAGTATREDLFAAQERFDNHFADSAAWERHVQEHRLT